MMNGTKNNGRTTDRTGQQLGNYELLLLLERSKFSRVYLGEHIQFKMQHIIRTWQVPLAEELIGSFLRQTHTLAQLQHPHILRLRDAGVENFFPFVVMEYVSHVTLQQPISRGTPQSFTDILFHLKSIAEALQYAHNRHVLHKNIRPRNILLSRNNDVLLSNFTIDAVTQSKQQPDFLTAEEVTESLGYMAPEQIEGKAVPASDQYALAVIIYQWLCGVLPFRGPYSEIVNSHLHVQPPSLCQRVPAVSRAVEEVVFTALAKDPNKRFPDVLMFIEALHQAQQQGDRKGSPLPYYTACFVRYMCIVGVLLPLPANKTLAVALTVLLLLPS